MDQLATQFLASQSGSTAAWIGAISVIIFAIVKIKKAVSAVWPFVKKLVTVVEDLFGAEARPGVPARPGLMARMQQSEENDLSIASTLQEHSQVLLELQPNHGGSMKDVLRATREELKALRDDLTSHINDQRAAVTNAEASVVNAEAAASGARDAVVGAQEAVIGAREAVVGARAAVVSAESAVEAATKDRAAINVNVHNTP